VNRDFMELHSFRLTSITFMLAFFRKTKKLFLFLFAIGRATGYNRFLSVNLSIIDPDRLASTLLASVDSISNLNFSSSTMAVDEVSKMIVFHGYSRMLDRAIFRRLLSSSVLQLTNPDGFFEIVD
jgi:hypothetical protein